MGEKIRSEEEEIHVPSEEENKEAKKKKLGIS